MQSKSKEIEELVINNKSKMLWKCSWWQAEGTNNAFLRRNGDAQCIVYEGGTTKELFEAYIAKQLYPTLISGDVVIMDNLPAHKSSCTTKSIEERGVNILCLSPYNPDLNPIEKMWVT